MNLSFFIANKLTRNSQGSFASKIVNIAIAGVALGFAVIIIAIATVNGFQKEIVSKVTGFSGEIEIRKTGSTGNFDYPLFALPEDLEQQIKEIKGVKSVNKAASKPGIIKANDELLGVIYKGVDSSYNADFYSKYLTSGKLPGNNGEVLISQLMSKKLNLKVGDKVRIFFIKQPVRAIAPVVSGIYQTGLEEYDKMIALGSMSDIQRIFADREAHITHLELSLYPSADPKVIEKELYDLLDYDLDCHLSSDLHPQIFQWLEYLDVNKYIILILMTFVSGISLVTALLILVIERTNMIGILKTLGTSNWSIKKIFLYKISYIAFIGIGIGNLLGVGLCYIQLKTGIFKLNQETYYIDSVPIDLEVSTILFVNLACFLICFIALLLPVQMVTKISPAKSVRFD